jgi:cytosine/adenosine deaminase-related metal-dependent hydrolase
VRYAADLDALHGALAVHANYLDGADVALLAEAGATVVWCPGAHRFFGHPPHPAPRLLAAGVPLALGTDSLASNEGLTMLREVRLAAEAFPGIDRAAWLRAGTLAGAEALGLASEIGSLELGKAADIQVLSGVPEGTTDPLEPLFGAPLGVLALFVEGQPVRIP